VLSARVVVTPLGEVSEIHVLTMADTQPKQVVRNIESALMAQLRPEDRPPQDQRRPDRRRAADRAAPGGGVRSRAKRRVVVFQGLEVRPSERPQAVLVRVKLSFEGKDATAEGARDRHDAQPCGGGGAGGVALSGRAARRQLGRA